MPTNVASQRPPSDASYSAIDPFIGQRFIAALVDVCFFAVICIFGVRKVIGEVLIGTLLSSYAAYRFGISQGKQQAVMAMSASGAFNGPSGGGGSGGGSGSQPRFQAVRPDIRTEGEALSPIAPPATVPRPRAPNDDHHRTTSDDAEVPESDPLVEHQRALLFGLTRR